MRSIVTGAAQGIGAAICEKLAAAPQENGQRAQIIASDINADSLHTTAESLREQYGAEIVACAGDVSGPEEPQRLIDMAGSEFGGLDALFSNVGLASRGSIINASVEEWDRLFSINVKAPWLLARAAAPLLEQSNGAIIFTTSVAASNPAPFGPYSVTKAAVVMLMKQLSVELGPRGIRVNSVAPSMVYTAGTAKAYAQPETEKRRIEAVPLRRLSHPDEVADVVYFLASPAGRYVSGVDMQVDGAFGNTLMYTIQGAKDWS